jgi:two-component system CheB/CheR fusion protein
VRLPLAPSPSPEDPARRLERRPLPADTRVVVVEDNADSRDMLCELLRRAGVECQAAESGTAALGLIDAWRPNVVILDLGLPGMDGFEIARRLRASDKYTGIRLIALTGYGQAADRTAAQEAGFDVHLVKPVNGDHLLTLLR